MRKLQAGELSRLQSIQGQAMNDVCNIEHWGMVTGTYGQQLQLLSVASGTSCGIHMTGGLLAQRGAMILVEYDVVLRLSASQPVAMNDRITLVEKGTEFVSGTFQLYSEPRFNSSVQILQLKRKA